MTRSTFPIGASIVTLNEASLGDARCVCCSIICFPADDGRCAKCVERDASVCPDCGVHVYADERSASGRCDECHEAHESAVRRKKWEALYRIPADAVKPLTIPCRRHSAAIGETCGDSFCDLRYYEARRLLEEERLRQAKAGEAAAMGRWAREWLRAQRRAA